MVDYVILKNTTPRCSTEKHFPPITINRERLTWIVPAINEIYGTSEWQSTSQ
jgi:hypothetical protein